MENAELIASIHHIAKFLKSEVPICNSEVPDTTGRKPTTKRGTQVIEKRFAFNANATRDPMANKLT